MSWKCCYKIYPITRVQMKANVISINDGNEDGRLMKDCTPQWPV